MDEGETNGPDAPPLLGGLTADEGLIPPSAEELQGRGDLALFVGPNVEKFVCGPGSSGPRRFAGRACWPGFFFPLAWFMYRKMYGWAALACTLPILASAMNFGPLKPVLISLPTIGGVAGRRFYVVGARRTMARIRASLTGGSEDELRDTLARAGGVSVPGAIIGGEILLCAIGMAFAKGFIAGLQAQHHP
jgi:hypothetical protein